MIKNKQNWLEKWWEDLAYLSVRDLHFLASNFAAFLPVESVWPAQDGSQVERAALYVWHALRYWQILRKEQVKVQYGGKTTVWCMYQYERLFNGCKTPKEGIDQLNDYFKTEAEGPCPSHVTVMCRGRLCSVDVLDADGHLRTAPELQEGLQYIRDLCDSQPE